MKKIFNITVIGAGKMGKSHIRFWKEAGHHVVSIVDLNQTAAKELSAQYKVPDVYEDYKEALLDENIDIVSICLPVHLHAQITIYAAQQGKHIMCEKPLCHTLDESEAMEKAVKQAGVHFCVGFQRNSASDLGIIKKLIDDGELGQPLVYQRDMLKEVRPNKTMHDKYGNNGPIVDCACHYWLFAQTLFDSKPKSVYARGGIFAKGRPELSTVKELAVDTAQLIIGYESGDTCIMNISWGLAKGSQMSEIHDRIIGPKGGVEINNINEITLYIGDQKEPIEIEDESPRQKLFEAFTQAITENTPSPMGFQQGREMIKIADAVLESIEKGHEVVIN